MSPIRKLLLVGVGVLALHGVQACASETELNPQPLPPQGGSSGDNVPPPDQKGEATGANGGSSGSSGSAGAPADASDGGTDGGDSGAD
jgi:hypothetical protein